MESVDSLLKRLEQLNDIGASLSKERDTTLLLEHILLAAKTTTHADGRSTKSIFEPKLAVIC